MNIKWTGALALLCCLVGTGNTSLAQGINSLENPDWAEGQVPPPPAFSTAHVLPLEMPPHISVKVGVDADSIQVGDDGVVRYVIVMGNRSGNTNAVYEGIRCASGDVKTYARLTSGGAWTLQNNAPWRPLTTNMPSPHAIAFARQAACDGPVAFSSREILEALKTPKRIIPTTH